MPDLDLSTTLDELRARGLLEQPTLSIHIHAPREAFAIALRELPGGTISEHSMGGDDGRTFRSYRWKRGRVPVVVYEAPTLAQPHLTITANTRDDDA